MTEFIWDGSSFDGHITVAQFQQAMTEGIVAFTHRLLRQTGEVDAYAAGNLTNAKTAGMPLLGAYGVTYTAGGDRQDDLLVQLADQQVPWWRTFDGWFWQEDLEKWSTDPVAASLGISSASQLRAGTARKVVLYASHGQYGNQLTGWDGPLWNADYTSHAPGTVRAMYPGDNWRPSHGTWTGGWTAYSGREPDFLQFTSSATIGGLTTCDASAFRGTLDQLRALLTGGTMTTVTDSDGEYLIMRMDAITYMKPAIAYGPETGKPVPIVLALKDLVAKVDALAAPAPVDPAAVAAAIDYQKLAAALAAHIKVS